MTRRDWLFAGLFTLGSFVLCVLWLQFPAEKIFDEIYYARAGEEYLHRYDVNGLWSFEFTHPPLTKLIITLSMMLFGGLHGARRHRDRLAFRQRRRRRADGRPAVRVREAADGVDAVRLARRA